MKKEFDYLEIYRRIFLFFWIKVHTTNSPRLGNEDVMNFFRKYRDVYSDRYGNENVKIKMIWESESFDGNGNRYL